jgi:hypothetical protein
MLLPTHLGVVLKNSHLKVQPRELAKVPMRVTVLRPAAANSSSTQQGKEQQAQLDHHLTTAARRLAGAGTGWLMPGKVL